MSKTPIITWPWSLGWTVGRQQEFPEIQQITLKLPHYDYVDYDNFDYGDFDDDNDDEDGDFVGDGGDDDFVDDVDNGVFVILLTPEVGHWHCQGFPRQSKAPLACEHPPKPPCHDYHD